MDKGLGLELPLTYPSRARGEQKPEEPKSWSGELAYKQLFLPVLGPGGVVAVIIQGYERKKLCEVK